MYKSLKQHFKLKVSTRSPSSDEPFHCEWRGRLAAEPKYWLLSAVVVFVVMKAKWLWDGCSPEQFFSVPPRGYCQRVVTSSESFISRRVLTDKTPHQSRRYGEIAARIHNFNCKLQHILFTHSSLKQMLKNKNASRHHTFVVFFYFLFLLPIVARSSSESAAIRVCTPYSVTYKYM